MITNFYKSFVLKLFLPGFIILPGLVLSQLQTYTFTNCGATGPYGPSVSQVTTAYASSNLSLVSTTGPTTGIQTWTVPQAGVYRIEAYGASGQGAYGGLGAYIAGNFSLNTTHVLKILVGQAAPASTMSLIHSGGGGSFVTYTNNVPLLIAGGGGGSNSPTLNINAHGTVTTKGNDGYYGNFLWANGGTLGLPGMAAGWGGGGGGLTGTTSASQFGTSFSFGGFGSVADFPGGFGGGAGIATIFTNNPSYCGGGGGYGGGGGGIGDHISPGIAGGGGSLNNGLNPVNISGVNSGHGKVIVTQLCSLSLGTSVGSRTICLGSAVTLTSSAASGYTWNTGSNASSISVSPSTNTNYTLTASVSPTCVVSAVLSIIVASATPVLSLTNTALAPNGVCPGKSFTLTASGASSYTWSGGIVNAASSTLSSSSSFTVTGANACGTSSAVTSVSIHPSPTINVNPPVPAVCQGSGLVLNVSGAQSYTFLPFVNTGVSFTPAATTAYTVSGHSAQSCSAQTLFTISVVPFPTLQPVASSTLICEGTNAVLSGSGAASYTWLPGNLNTASISVSPSLSTTYTLLQSNGNCQVTRTLNISVNPAPVFTVQSPGGICGGSAATLQAIGNNSYTWMPGSVVSSSLVASPASGITFTLLAINAIGCPSSALVPLSVTPMPNLSVTVSNPTFCAGGSTSISAQGAASYTWLPTQQNNSLITVSPTLSTTYTLSGANGTCVSQVTVPVIVNPYPNLQVSAVNSTLCTGNMATLSVSGANTYTWQPGNMVSASVVVNPSVSTVYSISGNFNASACTSQTQATLTVVQTPTVLVSTSSNSFCAGGSVSLSASGAFTYTWNPGGLNGAQLVLNPTVSTIYTVTGESSSCKKTNTLSLIILPAPSLSLNSSNPVNLCTGDSLYLQASGAISYTWLPLNLTGSILSSATPSSTTYTLVGVNSNSCYSQNQVTVSLYPWPSISASSEQSIICVGESINLTAGGASTYIWTGGLTGSLVTVSPTLTTSYTVTGSNIAGCSDSATVLIIVDECLGLREVWKEELSLLLVPNPANDQVKVLQEAVLPGMEIVLYDMLGYLVGRLPVQDKETILDLRQLTQGIYLLSLEKDGQQLCQRKLIKN